MDAIRHEMGRHMGKIEGIWVKINCTTPQGDEARAAKRAISLSRITKSNEIKPPIQRQNVLQNPLRRYFQKIGIKKAPFD